MGKIERPRAITVAMIMASLLSGCASFPDWLSSSGPSREQVVETPKDSSCAIRLVGIADAAARRVLDSEKRQLFSEKLAGAGAPGYVVGPGDVLEVSIWEAPPAALFGAAAVDSRMCMTSTRASALPEQMVAGDGTVNVPFAGAVLVAGKGLCGQRAGGGAAEVPQYSDFVVVLGEQSGESGKLILC